MKKLVSSLFLVAALFGFTSFVSAEQFTASGTNGGGGGSLQCSVNNDGSVTLGLANFRAIRSSREGNFQGGVGTQNFPNNTAKDFIYDKVVDGTVEIYGLGSDWAGMATNVDKLDSSKALGGGQIVGGVATVTFRTNLANGINLLRFNGRIKTNHGNGWFWSGSLASNVAQDAAGHWENVVAVDSASRQCVQLTSAMKAYIATLE